MGVGTVCCQERRPAKNIDNVLDPYSMSESNNDVKSTHTKDSFKKSSVQSKTSRTLKDFDFGADDQERKIVLDTHINMFIERFDLVYKLVDDFGMEFTPRIKIQFFPNFERTIEIKRKDFDFNNLNTNFNGFNGDDQEQGQLRSKEESSKWQSDKNLLNGYSASAASKKTAATSTNLMLVNNASQNPNDLSFSNMTKIESYYFNTNPVLNTEGKIWEKSKLRITLQNVNFDNSFSPVTVGVSHISLGDLSESKFFEGRISVLNKFSKVVGYFYLRIKLTGDDVKEALNVSEISFNGTDIMEDPNANIMSGPVENETELNNAFIPKYSNLDQYVKEQFQTGTKGNGEKLATKNLDYEDAFAVADGIIQAIKYNNDVVLYDLLYDLNNRLEESELTDSFNENLLLTIKELNNKGKQGLTLLDFPTKSLEKRNLALIKLYFTLLNRILVFNNKYWTAKNKLDLLFENDKLDIALLESTEVIMGFLKEISDSNELNAKEEREEIFEIIISILNLTISKVSLGPTSKLKKSEAGMLIFENSYNTCIYILKSDELFLTSLNLFIENSQIVSLYCKLYRKCVHTLIDSLNKQNISEISNSLLLNMEQNRFLTFILTCVNKYYHYPEVYANLLLIIISFTKMGDVEIIRAIINTVKISDLIVSFESYRWTLKNIGKTVNNFFFELLANLTNTIQSAEMTSGMNKAEVKKIGGEMLTIFKGKVSDGKFTIKKNIKKFIYKKSYDIHESLSKIAMNLAKLPDGCAYLTNEKNYLVPHLFEYLLDINKTFVTNIVAKTKMNSKVIEQAFLDIVENTLSCLTRLVTSGKSGKSYIGDVLAIINQPKEFVSSNLLQICEISNLFKNSEIKQHIEVFLKLTDDLYKEKKEKTVK